MNYDEIFVNYWKMLTYKRNGFKTFVWLSNEKVYMKINRNQEYWLILEIHVEDLKRTMLIQFSRKAFFSTWDFHETERKNYINIDQFRQDIWLSWYYYFYFFYPTMKAKKIITKLN